MDMGAAARMCSLVTQTLLLLRDRNCYHEGATGESRMYRNNSATRKSVANAELEKMHQFELKLSAAPRPFLARFAPGPKAAEMSNA